MTASTSSDVEAASPTPVDPPDSTLPYRPRVMVPLYIYPLPPPHDPWRPLIEAIRSNPDVDFCIIINPDSGPGHHDLPSRDYQRAIPSLRAAAHPGQVVELIGYVLTDYAKRNPHLVALDVHKYAVWPLHSTSTHPQGDMRLALDGIFLDEVSWHRDESLYYHQAAEYIRDTFHGIRATWSQEDMSEQQSSPRARSGIVVLNPGCWADDEYYSFADHVVLYENNAATFDPTRLLCAVHHPEVDIDPRKRALMFWGGDSAPPPPKQTSVKAVASPLPYISSDLDTILEYALGRARVGAIFYTALHLDHADVYAGWGSSFQRFVRTVGSYYGRA